MIASDFLVMSKNGLYCKAGDFYLDPPGAAQVAVISHAHADHAAKGHAVRYATAPTLAIIKLRDSSICNSISVAKGYKEAFYINGVKLTFYPAGHILGSAQVLMEWNNARYLYTGDIKLQEDPTCEAAEFCKADVLITETTFANPSIKHPDPEMEIRKLNDIPYPILLGAYSLGKSQRLIALINRFCPGKRVLVHYRTEPVNQLYRQFGFNPGNSELYSRKRSKEAGIDSVYLVPPLTFNSYLRAPGVVRLFASGWDHLQVKNGTGLFISDHADWDDLLTVIRLVKPSEIWTVHGSGVYLKEHFRNSLIVNILA
jgi:putative mRNA 3-end processing factor